MNKDFTAGTEALKEKRKNELVHRWQRNRRKHDELLWGAWLKSSTNRNFEFGWEKKEETTAAVCSERSGGQWYGCKARQPGKEVYSWGRSWSKQANDFSTEVRKRAFLKRFYTEEQWPEITTNQQNCGIWGKKQRLPGLMYRYYRLWQLSNLMSWDLKVLSQRESCWISFHALHCLSKQEVSFHKSWQRSLF